VRQPDHCLICGVEIAEKDHVYIERHHDGNGEEGWTGDFCGNEHAAAWVAAPFQKPVEPMSPREEWADRLFFAVALTILAFVLVSFGLGAARLADWIFDLVF
jgi:hypothetical protein